MYRIPCHASEIFDIVFITEGKTSTVMYVFSVLIFVPKKKLSPVWNSFIHIKLKVLLFMVSLGFLLWKIYVRFSQMYETKEIESSLDYNTFHGRKMGGSETPSHPLYTLSLRVRHKLCFEIKTSWYLLSLAHTLHTLLVQPSKGCANR